MSSPTLLDFFEHTYLPRRLLGRSLGTVDQYRLTIARFGGHRPVSSLSEDALMTFAAERLRSGVSFATVNKDLRQLKALWRLAKRLKVCRNEPTVEFLPQPRKMPVAWSPADVARLLDACLKQKGWIGPLKARDFWHALVLVLYDTGVRKGAVLNLPLASLDLVNRWLIVPAELQKTHRDQILSFSQETAEALVKIAMPARQFLFPWPYDRFPGTKWVAFNRRLRKIVHQAGLDCDHGHCQRLRRTRASLGERESPGSATQDLGHSSRSVTVNHYLDPRIVGVSRVADLLPRPGR